MERCPFLLTRGVAFAADPAAAREPALHELVPRFVVGFLVVLALRSSGLIPTRLLASMATAATLLTTISMAALGIGVDVRVVAQAGLRVTGAVGQ